MIEEFATHCEEETVELGRRLAARVGVPGVLLLVGQLGSGKTVLTRGLALGFGLSDSSQVRSPTFSLVNMYEARDVMLYHVDLYRLESRRDLDSIGFEELLDQPAVVIVEWAERIPFSIQAAWRIRLQRLAQNQRKITVESPDLKVERVSHRGH